MNNSRWMTACLFICIANMVLTASLLQPTDPSQSGATIIFEEQFAGSNCRCKTLKDFVSFANTLRIEED